MPRKQNFSYQTEKAIFAQRLNNAMQLRGENQTTLAEKSKITRQTIQQYASGQSKPDTDKLTAIANALDVRADYLLGITDDYRRFPIAVDDLHLTNEAANNLRAFSNMDEEMQILNQMLVSVNFWTIIHDVCEVKKLSGTITENNRLLRENAALEARKEYRRRTGSSKFKVLHGENYMKFLQYEITDSVMRLIQKVSGSSKKTRRGDNGNG